MRCKKEEFVSGGYFHVYNHAVADDILFRDAQNYNFFADKMQKNACLKHCILVCWCLMSNHYHYLVKQGNNEPAYKIFNCAAMSYINYYNHKYQRKGRLFNKLQHRKVVDDNYLLQLCLYIHLNPVKDGFVKQAENWQYSDYQRWINNKSNNEVRDDIFDFKNNEYKKILEEKIDERAWKKMSEDWC